MFIVEIIFKDGNTQVGPAYGINDIRARESIGRKFPDARILWIKPYSKKLQESLIGESK